MAFRQDVATQEERRRLFPNFVWVIVLCGPIALYSLFSVYSHGVEGMLLDRDTGISINTSSNGYIVDAQLMLVSICSIAAWINRFRLLSLLPLIGFVLFRAGQGGRGPFVAAVVSCGLFYLFDKRLKYPGLRVFLMLVPLILLFRIVGDDRGSAVRALLDTGKVNSGMTITGSAENTARPLESMDYANMEFMEYLVHTIPERSGTYDYFADNLQVFTEPVPRVLWPQKPVGPPIKTINLMDYGFPIGITRSVPGEGWYTLGWVGVFIWCSLYGFVTGTIYRKFVQSQQSAFQTAAFMVFMPSLIVAFRDGMLLTLVRSTGIYMLPILIWYAISRHLGVPSLTAIRSAMAEQIRLRRLRAEPQASGTTTSPQPAMSSQEAATWARLPAAVRRRRLALQQMRSAEPTP